MLQTILRRLLRVGQRLLFKPFIGPPWPLGFQRAWLRMLGAFAPAPHGTEVERAPSFLVPTWRIRARAATGECAGPDSRPVLLWAHGGGFTLGDIGAYRGLAGHLAEATGATVLLPEYRLAPENPYPAATDDLFGAYRSLLDRGVPPGRIALGGDSAGGALAVLTALAAHEMDVPAPAALVLFSPVTDLALTGESVSTCARAEPMLRRGFLEFGFRSFAGPLALTDPRIAPLYADLGPLPPTLIQVGGNEVLLDDSLRFANRALRAGAEVELQRFDGMWHDFQALAGTLRRSREALAAAAAFLRARWRSA